MKRRDFLATSLAIVTLPLLQRPALALNEEPRRLELLSGRVRLRPDAPATAVWGYDALVPGPVLKVRQGERVLVEAVNSLPEPTTIHWHGLRLPNAMDGVPDLTQPPIPPGGRFLYDFVAPDAGTFWYHPHFNTSGQMGRGLYGALIVEEAVPSLVERDLLWVLSDWRLDAEGQIVPDFADPEEQIHEGRIGEVITLNESVAGDIEITAGERLRIRLVNAAQARIFALEFQGHSPIVIARDGQPCEPYAPEQGLLWLGPGMRADIILDAGAAPGSRLAVVDRRDPAVPSTLVTLAYGQDALLRDAPLGPPLPLAPNPLPVPDLQDAEPLTVTFAGGMSAADHARHGADHGSGPGWTVEGRTVEDAHGGHGGHGTHGGHGGHGAHQAEPPLFRLALGRTYRLEMINDSDWWHPVHLHGMHMLLLSENGGAVPRPLWLDTLLLPPRGRAEAALVADNPGLWMLHCHVIQHQEAGMSAVLEVA